MLIFIKLILTLEWSRLVKCYIRILKKDKVSNKHIHFTKSSLYQRNSYINKLSTWQKTLQILAFQFVVSGQPKVILTDIHIFSGKITCIHDFLFYHYFNTTYLLSYISCSTNIFVPTQALVVHLQARIKKKGSNNSFPFFHVF